MPSGDHEGRLSAPAGKPGSAGLQQERTQDSTHHSIETARAADWLGRWDLRGLDARSSTPTRTMWGVSGLL